MKIIDDTSNEKNLQMKVFSCIKFEIYAHVYGNISHGKNYNNLKAYLIFYLNWIPENMTNRSTVN